MRSATAFLLLFILAAAVRGAAQTSQGASPPQSSSGDNPATVAYDRLVERMKAGDQTVDFSEARRVFTETPAYTGAMMVVYRSLWGALGKRDFAGALEIADAVLQRDYVEPNAHMVAAEAHHALGHTEQAAFHQDIAEGLLRSIMSRGDGKTSETAFQVIDVSEEYALFRAMRLKPESQSLEESNGGPFVDRMVVIDGRTNEERVMYFRVTRPMTLGGGQAIPPR